MTGEAVVVEVKAQKAGEGRVLDVGCGCNAVPGAIGIDYNPRTGADVIHDLNLYPYPFESDSFDEVVCRNVMEHLLDVRMALEEIHRISAPSALVKITVPFFRSRWAFMDPDHRHFFSAQSFDYFVRGTELASYSYTDKWFHLERIEYRIVAEYRRFSRTRHLLDRWFLDLVNRHKRFYEAYFAHFFPVDEIYVVLRVEKDDDGREAE